MTATNSFKSLLEKRGTNLVYRKGTADTVECDCRTPEGFCDPLWHIINDVERECDENGFIPQSGENIEIIFKGFLQAAQSRQTTRVANEYMEEGFSQFEEDDHLCIVPEEWEDQELEVFDWDRSGVDVIYEPKTERYYTISNVNLNYDPGQGNTIHHFEVALRLINPPEYIPTSVAEITP